MSEQVLRLGVRRATHPLAMCLQASLAASLAATLLASTAAAQVPAWGQQAPSPTAKDLAIVDAVSADEVWILASSIADATGDLFHTADGGQSWESLEITGANQIRTIDFVDPLVGWAAGNGIFRTDDGGQTWVQQSTFGTIYDLDFVDDQTGWGAGNGGVVYRTTDGGATWSTASTPAGATIRGVDFVNSLEGWAVGFSGRVVKTVDGGVTWTLSSDLTTVPGISGIVNITDIVMLNFAQGLVLGGSTIAVTLDGGGSWIASNFPPTTWSLASSLENGFGVAIGNGGDVLVSNTGGLDWSTSPASGAWSGLRDVVLRDGVAWIVGDDGLILRSTDLGQSFEEIARAPRGAVVDLEALDAKRAWAATESNEVARTTDGGGRWTFATVDGFDADGEVRGVAFSSPLRGFAAGVQPVFGQDHGRVSVTQDGGASWSLQLAVADASFDGICAIDADSAVAFGADGTTGSALYRTDDSGLNWTSLASPTMSGTIHDVHFLPLGETGWAVGVDIHKTTDGGQSWNLEHAGGAAGPFASVHFSDPLRGWACGAGGVLLRTVDGGRNWIPQDAGVPIGTDLLRVHAIGPDDALVCGTRRFAARTVDGGQSWTSEPLPPEAHPTLTDISLEWGGLAMLDAGNGWIAGREGILALSNGSTLVANPTTLSVKQGGPQRMALRPGVAFAGQVWLMLGSTSGTVPASVDPVSGVSVPLVVDAYTLLLLNTAGAGLVVPAFGVVDSEGWGLSGVALPAFSDPALAGTRLHHAFVTIDLFGTGAITSASDAASLDLVR